MASSSPPNIANHLKVLRESLEAPFLTHPVHDNDLVIYYDVDGGRAVSSLPAFGVGQTDTLDEAYRKAGKIDLNRFAARQS
ncbi:hypothetical protein C8J57DRAFT_1491881 [Mycena rebaudengoi]|nr:hypothetical protein C8J57DRAFT_1491881 [Mycena rebaudengoi]